MEQLFSFHTSRARAGFTLVELVIYFAILGMVITAFAQFIFSISTIRNKASASQIVERNMRAAMAMMSEDIREADDVGIVFVNENFDSLQLNSNNPLVWNTELVDERRNLVRIENGESVTIMDPLLQVSALTFTALDQSPSSTSPFDIVRIEMTAHVGSEQARDQLYEANMQTSVRRAEKTNE